MSENVSNAAYHKDFLDIHTLLPPPDSDLN